MRKMLNWWMVYYNFTTFSSTFSLVTISSFFSFSFSTPSLFFFSPLSFKQTTVPYLVVIKLHYFFGLTCVFAEKDPLPCSDNCFASCPTWTSRFLIEALVFFWFEMDTCINWVSYPNFVRGLLLDDMQSLVSRFEILGVLCCTINEVPRRLKNLKEASLRDPWNSVMWRKSKRDVFAQFVSFRNFFES